MADEKIRMIFGKNLKKWLHKREKTQADLCRYMGISSASASDWCNGHAMPRADKLNRLAHWLGIELNDLLLENSDTSEAVPDYYYDDDARDLAQFLFENPEYKVLFDGLRKVKKEDLEVIKALLEKFS